jgi:hypothetical protein
MAFPSLRSLQLLFHYNPINGEISYLVDRGPKKAGQLAGCTQGGFPCIYVQGKYYKAVTIAWMLAHGELSPQHIMCIDGNKENLRLCNLKPADEPAPSPRHAGRRARRPAWQKRDIFYDRTFGLWITKFQGEICGEFATQKEAIAAWRAAAKDAGEQEQNA